MFESVTDKQTDKQTNKILNGSFLDAKFHLHRCNVSPLLGEKPQYRPLSNNLFITGALRCAAGYLSGFGFAVQVHPQPSLQEYHFCFSLLLLLHFKLFLNVAGCRGACPRLLVVSVVQDTIFIFYLRNTF